MPQPSHIARLRLPDQNRVEDDIKQYFSKCEEKLGLVPNVLRAYTIRPEKLRNFISLYNEVMLGDSGLTKLDREMIAAVVSSCNRCYYGLVAHGQAVRQYSGDAELGELMVTNYRVAEIEPRPRAMLDFAWKLTEAPDLVDDADIETLRQHGFSDEDIFDICDTAAFINMLNRMAHALDIMPNRDYHGMSR